VKVARSEDLRAIEGLDTELFEVDAGDESVVIGRRGNGQVVAFARTCPHEGTELAQATFVDGMIRCTRHNYLYDPCTGENVVPFRISPPESMWKLHPGYLPTYSVEERDGWVWVATQPGPPPKVWDPELEVRPPRAERQMPPLPSAKDANPAGPVVAEAEHLEVDLSAAFELELPMDNAPPAHAWNIEATESILTVLEKRLEMQPTPHLRVRIVTRELGQGTVTCTFGRPWDKTPAEIRKYIVDVAVRT
jgi:nitrite reductase/ring-hydroxylating ferredoxin subunit